MRVLDASVECRCNSFLGLGLSWLDPAPAVFCASDHKRARLPLLILIAMCGDTPLQRKVLRHLLRNVRVNIHSSLTQS